jgi:sigma-B regulation protein RsbU (phosphoserine phosphatase)
MTEHHLPMPANLKYCHSLTGLNRLLAVTHVLASEIETSAVLDTIVVEATHALACERAILYQFDAKRNLLFASAGSAAAGSTAAGSAQTFVLPIEQGIAGHVARTRQLLNVPNAAGDSRYEAAYDREFNYRTETVLAVPLIAARDGRLLGVLEMLNNRGGPFDQDDESLALALAQHAGAALDRARLIDEIQRRRELDASLSVAREVQRRFMPSELPAIPNYEVASWWFPNEAVGGDYCDVVPARDGKVALCIADVSGHGLGPSLLMASVRASLRTLLLKPGLAPEVMKGISQALAADFQHGMFVTMVLGLLDPQRNQLEFANAGHGPALHYQASSRGFRHLESTGLPLGVLDDCDCPLGPVIDLAPNDLIVLGTDGIVEAMDQRGAQFGVERLQQIIARLASAPLPELVRSIGREVELHYVGESPPDDLTVLALRRLG